MTAQGIYGYDGTQLEAGCRVELHPGTDLWMRGARYGTVVRVSLTPRDRVTVLVDATGRKVSGPADYFRRVE